MNGQIGVRKVERKVVVGLLKEIERLQAQSTGARDMKGLNESRINDVRAALTTGKIFDEDRWSGRTRQEQRELLERLTVTRDGLLAQRRVERRHDPNYLLDRDGASKYSVIWLAVCGFVFAATLLSLLR
jgi:hypothetical protein